MKTSKYLAYYSGNVVVLFSLQINGNRKIAYKGQLIINQFTFSRYQWEHAEILSKKEFFQYDAPNCLDCPFRGGNGCYATKLHSWFSYRTHIANAKKEIKNLPDMADFDFSHLYKMARKASYLRCGAYGEPIFVPLEVMQQVQKIIPATGYTHQWRKFPDYATFLMASTHSEEEAQQANAAGFRSYTVILKGTKKPARHSPCPGDLKNQKSVCSDCLKCAGTNGKGSANIFIEKH